MFFTRAVDVFSGSFLVLFGTGKTDSLTSGYILSADLRMATSSIEFFVIAAISPLIAGRLLL